MLELLAGWKSLTDKYDCSLAQLVIAWTIAQPGVTVALCGARRIANVIENVAAARLQLDPADIATMRRDAEALAPL